MRSYSKLQPLLMIPGPVESSADILNPLGERALAHTEKEFVKTFSNALNNSRKVFSVGQDHQPIIIGGAGTLAMEIAMINLIDSSKSQSAVVGSTGYFGDRWINLAQAFQLPVSSLVSDIGHQLDMSQFDEFLVNQHPDFAFIQHVDTSTGVVNDLKKFGDICQKNGVISVVDSVCALGGQEFYQELWKIDICLTGAQKALSVPPGLAILMLSPRVTEVMKSRKEKVPSYYCDLDNWWPILDAYENGSVKYFSTPATNLISSLNASFDKIIHEGLENRFQRHRELSQYFRQELSSSGIGFLTDESSRANTMSTPLYPEGVDPSQYRSKLLENGVLVAGGLQAGIANRYFRVGHMGEINREQIDFTLEAINA